MTRFRNGSNDGLDERIHRFYDTIGRRHDWAEWYEGPAKALALGALRLAPGQRVLNVGAGTGTDQLAIVRAVGRREGAVAVDVSSVMLDLVRSRAGSPVVLADARRLPFGSAVFDRVLCTYVLDLLPEEDLLPTVSEFARVIRPGGLIGLVSMTGGITGPSRVLVRAWMVAYRANPVLCGGCRPLDLSELAKGRKDLRVEHHEVVTRLGFPSEVLVLRLPASA